MENKLTINTSLVRKQEEFRTTKCVVEKVIELSEAAFTKLITKPLEDNWQITANRELMWQDDDAAHCILFVDKKTGDGLLVESEGADYARYAQYIPHAKDIVMSHWQSHSEELLETKLYCPLYVLADDKTYETDLSEVDATDIADYTDEINNRIENSFKDFDQPERGLICYTDNKTLDQLVHSVFPSIENRNGEVFGVLTVKSYGELNDMVMSDLIDEMTGQLSDGWGESFEQHEVRLGGDNYYISFWNSGNGYYLKPENQVFPQSDITMKM